MPGTDCALPVGGGLLEAENGVIYFDGREIGAGEILGAGKINSDKFAFAISDGANGAVFTAENGTSEKRFAFKTTGRAEAYFTGGYVFLAPTHGDAAAYTLDGTFVRAFDESGFLAETGVLREYITAGYVSSASMRYSLLLDAGTLETAAYLPGFLGALDAGTLILDSGSSLRAAKLLPLQKLMEIARERLDGRTLTSEERRTFKAG
jgi:hypothetical protein